MKRFFLVLLLIGVLVPFVGCSGFGSRVKTANPDASSWNAMQLKLLEIASRPPDLLDLELNENGTIKKIRVGQQVNLPKIQQYRKQYHPAWALGASVLNTGLRVGGTAMGIKMAGDALEGLIKASRGTETTTTTIGSHNLAGGDVTTPVMRSRGDGTMNLNQFQADSSFNPVTMPPEAEEEVPGEEPPVEGDPPADDPPADDPPVDDPPVDDPVVDPPIIE